jgi:hypothetical protein
VKGEVWLVDDYICVFISFGFVFTPLVKILPLKSWLKWWIFD